MDPVTVLAEMNKTHRAVRLGAYLVIQEDTRRQTEKVKSSMPK